ncbi:carbohydrate porin [Sphingobium subterraneum]|uniref:Porin n=1 Tax=Sphingobium subterraneum TaxID=627688 RepID=A0A841J5A5_9SPHN|nr:carbohydrate porin [Sphingobium subterraneum]MBB6124716.1 porin [Sphingobium subterraneum]
MKMARTLACAATIGIAPSVADAEERDGPGLDVQVAYTMDVFFVDPGAGKSSTDYLDNLDLIADADLERIAGWRGARAHLYGLVNLGGRPNDRAGTLQGINNIEVSRQAARLFEAWLEQDIGPRTSVLAGLYDLNSEFYANDAAGLLIAPAFGIGTELSATGPNGPSIFPSTALAIRVNQTIGKTGYARAALFNANARTLGDRRGIDTAFRDGALAIAEGGIEGRHKLALGLWRYTKRQDDVLLGNAAPRKAQGAYVLAETPVVEREDGLSLRLFLRAGISDGKTTPFRGGWQAGLLATHVLPTRPDSALTFGANEVWLSRGYRAQMAADGLRPARAERAFELSYSDTLATWLTVQPDVQWIIRPGGERDRSSAWVAGLRTTLAF